MAEILDRREFVEALRSQLTIDPRRTAILAVDVHRGHLDPEIGTMPVLPSDAARCRAALARLLAGARTARVPVIYVLLTYRRTTPPGLESMGNPFWRAVEAVKQSLTPGRRPHSRGAAVFPYDLRWRARRHPPETHP